MHGNKEKEEENVNKEWEIEKNKIIDWKTEGKMRRKRINRKKKGLKR